MIPIPPWHTTALARGITWAWETKRSTTTPAGARTVAGSTPAVVHTSCTEESSPKAPMAASISAASSWNSVEHVTSTIGFSVDIHPGADDGGGGDQSPGPTSFMFAGQSLRGYSKGSAVMCSRSGGARYISGMLLNARAPALARTRLSSGRNLSQGPCTSGRSSRSRRRPSAPRAGAKPGPKGGASREG